MMQAKPKLGQLRTLIWVTTTLEVPDRTAPDVTTDVDHPPVYSCSAKITPLKALKVLDYKAVFGDDVAPTHEIILRMPPDVKIDLRHYIYATDRLGSTWYRVRAVEDMEGQHIWLRLLCSIYSVNDNRSDPVTQLRPPRHRPLETFG